MKRINSMVWGTVLLLVGVILTLNELHYISLTGYMTLPIILIALSVVFHLYYFLSRNGNEGLLVPGGILLVYGVMFALSSNVFDSGLWPMFILGPALGLLELYVFSRGSKGSLASVVILTVIGGSFLLFKVLQFEFVIAILLIGCGLAMMINAFVKSEREKHRADTQYAYTVNETPTPGQTGGSADNEPPK